ncbi:hypothetical protein PENTCL1PPCAC_14864, partial [Pristionchus entomophagus]
QYRERVLIAICLCYHDVSNLPVAHRRAGYFARVPARFLHALCSVVQHYVCRCADAFVRDLCAGAAVVDIRHRIRPQTIFVPVLDRGGRALRARIDRRHSRDSWIRRDHADTCTRASRDNKREERPANEEDH